MTGKTKTPRPSVSSLAVLTVSPPSRRENPTQPLTFPRQIWGHNAATLLGTTQLSRCDHETKISYEKKLFSYDSGLTLSYESAHHGSTRPLRADDTRSSQIRSGHPPAPLLYLGQTTNPKLAQSCNEATMFPPNPSAQITQVPNQIRSGHPPAPLLYPGQITNPKLAQSCNAATTVPPNPSAQTTPVPHRYNPP